MFGRLEHVKRQKMGANATEMRTVLRHAPTCMVRQKIIMKYVPELISTLLTKLLHAGID
jgi:hypothetical protein